MATLLEELYGEPGPPPEISSRTPYPDETPAQTDTRNAATQRIRAADLKSRGIPSYRDDNGDVRAVEDETGAALTAFDKRHGIAYDSSGQAKSVNYGESGAPTLSDPFAELPSQTDEKGNIYKQGRGLYQWVGTDPDIAAKSQQDEHDKEISKQSALLNRKLSLDEHDLTAGTRQQKAMKTDLLSSVPTLQDPKYHGADLETVKKGIDEHFDAQYAAPEANATRGWFSKDLSPEAAATRATIDQSKADAHAKAEQYFALNDRLGELHQSVSDNRTRERAMVETMLAHSEGKKGPLDEPPPAEYAPVDKWTETLPADPQEAPQHVVNAVKDGAVPAVAAPAAAAAAHEAADAQNKADGLKESNPTLAQQFESVAKGILQGVGNGVAELVKSPIGQGAIAAAGLTTPGILFNPLTGEWHSPEERATQYAKAISDANPKLDERLQGTVGAKIGNFAGGVLPYVAATIASGPAAPAVDAALFFSSGYQSTYDDAKAHGAGEDKAHVAGLVNGSINALLAMPLRTVGKAYEALFGDTTPKVIATAIRNAYEHGGPEATGSLLGDLAERIKAGGEGAEAMRQEAVEGINSLRDEILKTPAQRLADVAKTAAAHAAIGGAVQTAQNIVSQSYDPERGTFENVPEQAIGFGALGAISKGFEQVAAGIKAKRALDIIAKGGKEPPEALPGPEGKPTPPAPTGGETSETNDRRIDVQKQPAGGEPAKAGASAAEPSDASGAAKQPDTTDAAGAKSADEGAADRPVSGNVEKAPVAAGDTIISNGRRYTVGDLTDEHVELRPEDKPNAAPLTVPHEQVVERLANKTWQHEPATVDTAAHEAATSPQNGLPEPTQPQKEAGNYQKGHVVVGGLDVSIENPAGSRRQPEFQPLESHYGYIKGTVGADKDHVDVFIKPNTPTDYSGPVFVVNQHDANGKFDEHKAVIGVNTPQDALAEYKSNYQAGWTGGRNVVRFENPQEFKKWATSGAAGKPAIDTGVPSAFAKQAQLLGLTYTGETRSGQIQFADTAGPKPTTFQVPQNATPAQLGEKVSEVRRRMSGPQVATGTSGHGPLAEVQNLVRGAMNSRRASLEVVGHAPAVHETHGDVTTEIGIGVSDGKILVDHDKLAAATKDFTPRERSRTIRRAIDEEIVHVAAVKWERAHPDNRAKIEAWGKEDDEIGRALASSYSGWDKLNDRQKGHEKVRAVIQKRWTGRVTETARAVLSAVVKALRDVWDKLTSEQRGIVEGIESVLKGKEKPADVTKLQKGQVVEYRDSHGKTQTGTIAGAPATPQIPPLGGKYVLPSFVTAGQKPTKLQARASELTQRLDALAGSQVHAGGSIADTTIRTLLRSPSGKALDQAEKKIVKLEEQHATTTGQQQSSEGGELSRVPTRTDVPANPPEVRQGDGEQTTGRGGAVERGETPTKQPRAGQPEKASTLDAETQQAVRDAFDDLAAAKPRTEEKVSPKQRAIYLAVVRGGDVEKVARDYAMQPKHVEAIYDATLRKHGILGAGKPTDQVGIPVEKMPVFMKLASTLVSKGVDTPRKLATELDALVPGKGRKYSQALWDAIGMVKPELRETHDWPSIYAKLVPAPTEREEKEPYAAVRQQQEAAIAKTNQRNTLSDQIARRLLRKDATSRNDLTALAKDVAPDMSPKEIDETAEAGLVTAARTIVGSMRKAGKSDEDVFDRLVQLYNDQPNLTAKTSTSKVNQAYSTPMPLAWATSVMAGITPESKVLEPTAGNGALLIGAKPENAVANELNDQRRAALESQGFKVWGEDATNPLPKPAGRGHGYDVVVANPPFGTVLDDDQEKKTWPLRGTDDTTDQIDQAIALTALQHMKDDGRAVLILGGKNIKDPEERAKAYASPNQMKFWKPLYEQYRVVDHFTVDGDLYKKQGAGWPVDVVVIAGRGKSPIQLPSADGPRILRSWNDLRNELHRSDDDRIAAGRYDPQRDAEKVSGVIGDLRQLAGPEPAARSSGNAERADERPGRGENVRSPEGTATDLQPAAGREPVGESTEGPVGGVGAAGNRVEPVERGQLGDYRVPYKPASKLNPIGIFVPTNMEVPAREALSRLQEKVGSIDDFVRGKLGYRADAPLERYFAAEQMDALALAISAIEGKTAFVLGDQGGIGKGRVAAGMMAYALTSGQTPIFVTKDVKLYAEMIKDLADIGRPDIEPLFTDNDIAFEDPKGGKWQQGYMRPTMEEIARTGKLPTGSDVLFTTYAQIQSDVPSNFRASKAERAAMKAKHTAPPDGARMEALKKLAPNAIIIADESHLASGDSIRAWRLSPLLHKAHGVYYSSATFAKRPDSLGIYSRTSLQYASTSMDELASAMRQGGVPLQQVVSATLASDGLYLRRERDFRNAVFRTHINVETRDRDTELADNYTDGLRAILNISNRMKAATKSLNKLLRREGKTMHVENPPRVESTNFASKLHNLVSQYLFAIKAESAVRRAVKGVTKGFPNKQGEVTPHKVIIAVQNTMEQPILAMERSSRPLNFKGMLLAYLDTQRTLTSGRGPGAQQIVISNDPNPDFEKYSDKDLQRLLIIPNPEDPEKANVNEPALAELFRRIMAGVFREVEAKINGLDLADMPLSPIDHIRRELTKAGIKNEEITKRGTGIDEDGKVYQVPPSSNSKAAHLRYLSGFNNSDTDALVINASGSTGISAHASSTFKRQDPRAMIIAQPHLDINEFVQTLYRIDRTGQVHQPYYELLQTAIPAELRPAAILGRKMGSLNANTTSNAENEVSEGNKGTDIFNQYGDEVVYDYLRTDSAFVQMLDMPKIMSDDVLAPIDDVLGQYEEKGQFAAAVTGRVAVLPTAEQENFWQKVTADYIAKIDYLNQLGENELTSDTVDLKAETLARRELTPAKAGSSGFSAPSYLEKIRADIGMKPLPAAEVVQMMNEFAERAPEIRKTWQERSDAWRVNELDRLSRKVLSWDVDKAAHYEARWREQAEEINAALGLIGAGLHLTTEKGLDGYGAITDLQLDEEHPLTPSKQIFTVQVNTTKKTLRVPASQLPSIARMAVGDFAKIYEATAERSNERHMITGNLLAAYLAIHDSAPTAKIVQYTTDQGENRQGILMPAKFTEASLSQKRVVESATHMRQLLEAGRSLSNSGGEVTIVKSPSGGYLVRVPASRTMGGQFWRDQKLASLMDGGEFVERSGAMIGKFANPRIPEVYQRLLDLNASLFFTEAGDALHAGNPLKAAQALYESDVAPIARNIGMTVKESIDMVRRLVSPTSGVSMDAHDAVMKMLAERNQRAYETDRVLEGYRQMFDKMPREQQIDFIDRMKLGEKQRTPELQLIAETMRKIDTESWEAARTAYAALGFKDKEIPLAWLENHFRVLWKVLPGGEEKGAWIGRARRGLRGSMGQHKQHTLDTMSDGLSEGGVPYSYNPVVMFKLAQADLWKLTSTLHTWKWGKDNKQVEYVRGPFPKAPDGFVELQDSIARVYFPAESGEGLVNAGKYFVEEGFGRLLNNYLSVDVIRQTKLGRGLLWIKNATTMLELSLSVFHGVFEGMETVGSNIGLGLSKLVNRGVLHGDMTAAGQGLLDMITAIASPVTGFQLGAEIRKAAGDPTNYFRTAAGKQMLKSYPRAREMIDDLFAGGWKPTELEQDWKNNSVRTFVEAVSDIKAGTSDNYIGAGLRAFPAANEMLMKPLFDHFIPNLKVAQFFKEYAEAIEQNERKLRGGVLTRAALARQVWRLVEDRFGELNYDTLFWNSNFKTAMQLMFRSVTWKLGSVEAFAGAFKGQGKEFVDAFRERRAPELHRNMAWLFGMFLLTATLGYVMSKALGGKDPKNLTDYVFPQIDPKEPKVRVSLPTYFKDLVHLLHAPTNYVTSSMSGWIGRVADLMRNKDYYGMQIRNTDDTAVQQALQVGKYAGETLLPFSIRGYRNLSANDVGTLRKSLALVGVNPAPRYIAQSSAEKLSEEYWKGQQTEAGVSPEQMESSKEKRQLVAKIRHGELPNLSQALQKGTIKGRDVDALYARARMGALASQVNHMPLRVAEKINAAATTAEKAQLASIMARKRESARKSTFAGAGHRGAGMFGGF